LLKKLFIRIFGEDLLFEKQGYSGYPNESAEELLKGDYSMFMNTMNMTSDNDNFKNNRAIEWKIMNTEMFFRSLC
jgi:hypothetical protein